MTDTRHLTEDQLTRLRSMLEEQRAFRVEQLTQLADRAPSVQFAVDQEVLDQLTAGATAALAEIDRALARMTQDDYGLCSGCGEALAFDQLLVLPHLSICPRCQSGGY